MRSLCHHANPRREFIVAGYSYFNNNGSDIWDIYLFKIKSNGDTLWTKTFGKNDNNVAHAITQNA